jgi:hypothetical protein
MLFIQLPQVCFGLSESIHYVPKSYRTGTFATNPEFFNVVGLHGINHSIERLDFRAHATLFPNPSLKSVDVKPYDIGTSVRQRLTEQFHQRQPLFQQCHQIICFRLRHLGSLIQAVGILFQIKVDIDPILFLRDTLHAWIFRVFWSKLPITSHQLDWPRRRWPELVHRSHLTP